MRNFGPLRGPCPVLDSVEHPYRRGRACCEACRLEGFVMGLQLPGHSRHSCIGERVLGIIDQDAFGSAGAAPGTLDHIRPRLARLGSSRHIKQEGDLLGTVTGRHGIQHFVVFAQTHIALTQLRRQPESVGEFSQSGLADRRWRLNVHPNHGVELGAELIDLAGMLENGRHVGQGRLQRIDRLAEPFHGLGEFAEFGGVERPMPVGQQQTDPQAIDGPARVTQSQPAGCAAVGLDEDRLAAGAPQSGRRRHQPLRGHRRGQSNVNDAVDVRIQPTGYGRRSLTR